MYFKIKMLSVSEGHLLEMKEYFVNKDAFNLNIKA